MSKYIIEIPDDVQYVLLNGKADGKYYTAVHPVAELEILNSDYINEHYGELQDDAYQRGLEDGKAQSERGCEGCKYEWVEKDEEPCAHCAKCYLNHWAAKDDKIKVGDEVTDLQSGANFVVTHLWKNNHGEMGVSGFNNDCSAFSATVNKVKKTDRHFDITSILEAMRK